MTAGAADAASEAFIRIAGVAKAFDGHVAVDGLSLDIGKGELFCLLGASGSGKTTLLRLLAGFETPDRGTIAIDGIDLTRTPPYLRPVNLMFQSYALFPHMTVENNIAFGLRQEGMAKAAIADRVSEMLALVQMASFAQRRPHQLSGGQKQRIALARALAKHPKVLLLDEPLAALDRKLREETRAELVAIQERLRITFIVVTHDAEEAMGMASRIAIMREGRLAQIGAPQDLYARPHSSYVADFLGPVNLFEGRVVGRADDEWVLRCPDLSGEMRAKSDADLPPHERVFIAVRPEHLKLSFDPSTNCARGVVRDVVFRGESHSCRVELPSGKTLLLTAPTEAAVLPHRGEVVDLSWSAEAGVVLPE